MNCDCIEFEKSQFGNWCYTCGRRMINIRVEQLKRKIRRMKWHQRIELMDWMNAWYAAIKEEEE